MQFTVITYQMMLGLCLAFIEAFLNLFTNGIQYHCTIKLAGQGTALELLLIVEAEMYLDCVIQVKAFVQPHGKFCSIYV